MTKGRVESETVVSCTKLLIEKGKVNMLRKNWKYLEISPSSSRLSCLLPHVMWLLDNDSPSSKAGTSMSIRWRAESGSSACSHGQIEEGRKGRILFTFKHLRRQHLGICCAARAQREDCLEDGLYAPMVWSEAEVGSMIKMASMYLSAAMTQGATKSHFFGHRGVRESG